MEAKPNSECSDLVPMVFCYRGVEHEPYHVIYAPRVPVPVEKPRWARLNLTKLNAFLDDWREWKRQTVGKRIRCLPHAECQVRPITQLPKALQVQVWLDILAEKDISEVTGALVAARVKPLQPVKTPRVPVVAPVVAAAPAVMPDDVLTDLEACLSDHPKYDEIAQFIVSIRELVKAS